MDGDEAVGIFMGLESSSYEYIAWLIAPYRPDFKIEIGSLLLINNINEDIVARVMDYAPRGEFMSAMGEKWLNDIASQGAMDAIGSDIKKSKISYRVRIRVLGSMNGSDFSPGLRRVPQITSKANLPSVAKIRGILQKAMEAQSAGVAIGKYDLNRDIEIKFDQSELNSKRTFIFARAGYGKSNLMKVICSEWRRENGGLLVFDPEGEYAVTDKKGRPGVMDGRPAILLTNQKIDDSIGNVYPNVRLNLAALPRGMIIPLLVNQEKHTNIFFAKLMAMNDQSWPRLVSLLHKDGWGADPSAVNELVLGKVQSDASTASEMKPILNNLVNPIRKLHDPNSEMIKVVKKSLMAGHVTIFDISRLDAQTARLVSSIIVQSIFNDNKDNFIKHGGSELIRATFVLEEAHTVLSGPRDAPTAFVELAKEGRKYGLGGIFITQQPGSIPTEIVSQGDNFFVFHLLSKADLNSLSKSNAHYSDDIITQILNEPIPGKSYMWTSRQPFVIPIRVANFEEGYAEPHQSRAVQNGENILGAVKRQIHDEANDPTYKSICKKFLTVERKNPNAEIKSKTVSLFRDLDDGEKKYLEEKGCLQPNVSGGGFFTVTFPFYKKLLTDLG